MEFEQQKPITDEYRRGWNRVFGSVAQWSEQRTHNAPVVSSNLTSPTTYPNGCPILSEGPQKDDL